MSILIKDMEMPKNCCECPVNVNICNRGYRYLLEHPELYDKRANDCPLIEVSKHGRLIDADALLKDGWCLYKQVMRMDGYAIHEMSLSCPSLPIVIEAEE